MSYQKSLIIIIVTCILGGKCKCKHRDEPTKQPSKSTLIDPCPTPPSAPESSPASGSSTPSYRSGSSTPSYRPGSSTPSYRPGPTPPPSPPPATQPFAGLPNVGNTCYMNAVVQIIAALYPDLVTGPLKELINKINTGSKPLERDDIEKFRNDLTGRAKELAHSGKQEDADEFILALDPPFSLGKIFTTKRWFINQGHQLMVRDHSQVEHTKLIVNFKEGCSQLTGMIDSSMEKIVSGTLRNIDISHYKVINPDSDISNFDLLDELQPIDEVNNTCPNHIEQEIIDELPLKLCIQLNRFANSTSKIEKPIDGSFAFSTQSILSKQEDTWFNLHGFILHHGSALNSGHYTAYVKRNGKWYAADDASIIEKTEAEATEASKTAYLLFYEKQ